MSQAGWADASPPIRSQVERLAAGVREVLADALVGTYLHGSLVLECFNANRSDVDVLVVVERSTARAEKKRLLPLILDSSGSREPGPPRPLELHVLSRGDLDPWRYPTPYDLHYSESWRNAFERGVDAVVAAQREPDADLAAHLTVARRHGIPLDGPPPDLVLPQVPPADYRAALLADFEWARDHAGEAPRYVLLSMGRVWATLATGEIHSKDSGTAWTAERVPARLRPLLDRALASYRGDGLDFPVDEDALAELTAFLDAEVQAL